MRPRLLSRSLKHLDVGEVDLTSHIHVPAVNVQSYARNDCTGGFGHPMGHVSSLPSTWCGLPPGLVESQLLGGSQSQWSSAGSVVFVFFLRMGTIQRLLGERQGQVVTPRVFSLMKPTPCVHSKRLRVYRQNAYMCVLHVDVLPVHTGTF